MVIHFGDNVGVIFFFLVKLYNFVDVFILINYKETHYNQ